MVMSKSPSERSPTVTSTKDKPAAAAIKDPLNQSPDALREIVHAMMQEVLEAEKGERTAACLGYRSGYYSRALVGKLELRVPQDRDGRFSTELFERYQRSERYCQVGIGRRLWQGLGHEHDVQSVPRLPLSGRDHQPGDLVVSLLQPELA